MLGALPEDMLLISDYVFAAGAIAKTVLTQTSFGEPVGRPNAASMNQHHEPLLQLR